MGQNSGAGGDDRGGDRGGCGNTPDGAGGGGRSNANRSEPDHSAGGADGTGGGRAAVSVLCDLEAEPKRRDHRIDHRCGAHQPAARGAAGKDIADAAGDKADDAAAAVGQSFREPVPGRAGADGNAAPAARGDGENQDHQPV